MIFLLVFWLFLLGALTIGWQAGDRHDRAVVLAIGAASALSAIAHLIFAEPVSLILVSATDVALLAVVTRYALRTRRHWPIWFAAFHATSLLFGAAALLFPSEERMILLLISGFWALPALVALVIGLLTDQRHGIANTVD